MRDSPERRRKVGYFVAIAVSVLVVLFVITSAMGSDWLHSQPKDDVYLAQLQAVAEYAKYSLCGERRGYSERAESYAQPIPVYQIQTPFVRPHDNVVYVYRGIGNRSAFYSCQDGSVEQYFNPWQPSVGDQMDRYHAITNYYWNNAGYYNPLWAYP